MSKKVQFNTYVVFGICTAWFIGMLITSDLLGKNIKSTESHVGSLF